MGIFDVLNAKAIADANKKAQEAAQAKVTTPPVSTPSAPPFVPVIAPGITQIPPSKITTITTTIPKPPAIAPTPSLFKFQTPLDKLLGNLPKTPTPPTSGGSDNATYLPGTQFATTTPTPPPVTTTIPPSTQTIDNTAFNQYVDKLAAENPLFRGLVNAARSGVEIKPVSVPAPTPTKTSGGFDFFGAIGGFGKATYDYLASGISSLKTGYETLTNPTVQKIITEKSKENTSRFLAAIFNPEQFQLAYNVYSGTGESPDVIYERNYQAYKKLFEKKDISGIGLRVVQSPFVVVGSSYLMGAGLGGFAATKIGSTAAFNIGSKAITPSLALNTGVGAYFTSQMAKSGIEAYAGGNIKSYLGTTALSLPFFMMPFKAGYTKAGGYVQRTGAMSTVTDPLKRTQQQALYDIMKTTERLREPYLEQKSYDISTVQKPSPPYATEKFLTSPISKLIRKPAIGGSTAMDIQMGEFFREGAYPPKLLDIAKLRQMESGTPKELRISGKPVDIDILLGGKFATEKMAAKWGEKLDTHVHISKPNQPYFGGYSTKPFTESLVIFSEEPIKVKTLSIREQLLRYSESALPSAAKEKGYRSFKDITGLYDVVDVMQFQKGGTKLTEAMNRYINPENYQPPKITFGEKFIKGLGGSALPKWEEVYGGKYIKPTYPKTPYQGIYAGGYTLGRQFTDLYGYTKLSTPSYPNYKSANYLFKPYTPTTITPYKPPKEIKYTPYKPTDYTPPKPKPIITYKPTDYKPPDYTPPYTPPPPRPTYIPPPPYNPPPYTPPYKIPTYKYPSYKPFPNLPKKIYPVDLTRKMRKSLGLGKPIELGYRFRKWKTPRLEDLLGGKW